MALAPGDYRNYEKGHYGNLYGNPARDVVGYGKDYNNFDPKWPNGAKIAVQFVINYEEGGENCVLHGDPSSEWLLTEIVGQAPYAGERNMNMESLYEYGSRAGFWRLHRLFTERNMPCTVYAVAMALERNPDVVKAMLDAKWEIASHGYRWIDYQKVSEEEERKHIRAAVEIQKRVTGSRPLGIYQGKPNERTRRLVVEEGGFLYDADSYSDDLPYWNYDHGRPHLIVPYTLSNNDMVFVRGANFPSSNDFFLHLKDTFDMLLEEGRKAGAPKMMSVGLHCRIVGMPGRAVGLARFLDYVKNHSDAWVTTRLDIARHWEKHHPPKADLLGQKASKKART